MARRAGRPLFNPWRNDLSVQERQQLVESCYAYAYTIVERYAGYGRLNGVRMEDLVAAGQAGLVEAAARWDSRTGAPFVLYARWWVQVYVVRWISERRWFGMAKQGSKVERGQKLPTQTPAVVYKDGEESLNLLEAMTAIEPENYDPPEDGGVRWDRMVCRLPERERLAVELRFVDGLHYRDIGRRLGTSQEWGRKLVERAVVRLRQWLGEELKAGRTVCGVGPDEYDLLPPLPIVRRGVTERTAHVKKLRRQRLAAK